MKKTKLLYLGVFLVAFFAVVVVLGSISAPQEKKTAEESKCVASSLAGQDLVNGLGKNIKIPLFPGSTRYSFSETGASQYVAKAYDSDIFSFYQDRMRSLCWQVKDQRNNEIVYKNNGNEVRIALLPNPAGKTVIDYMVLASEGVLGQVKIAQTSCTSTQFWCNGSCVAMGTSCPSPTSSADCTGGSIYCPSTSGGSGWCQMSGSTCPSSTTGYTGSTATCSGTYQQSGMTSPSCNYTTCPNGCTWDSTGCPNGCYSSSSSTTTGSGSCTGSQVWCTSSTGSGGWCQTPPCPSSSTTTSTACSGTYQQPGTSSPSCNYATCPNGCTWDANSCPNGCNPSSTSSSCTGGQVWCPTSSGSGGWCQMPPCPSSSTSTYAGDANSCPGFSYSRWDSQGRRYCQLNNEVRCDYNYPSYLTNGSNYTAANCPAASSTGYSSCPSGQYMCNGSCISSSSSCSSTTWPTDSGSCTSQGKFWCTSTASSAGSSGGWCQSTACSTNYSSSSCPSGQWWCNSGCISTSTQCNGYYYSGSTTGTSSAGTREQVWNSLGLRSWVRIDADSARIERLKQSCANVPSTSNVWLPNAGDSSSVDFGMPSEEKCRSTSTSTSITWPTDQGTCQARGYFWCSGSGTGSSGWCSSSSCPNYNASCSAGQWNCGGTCISTGMDCNGQRYTGTQSNQQQQQPQTNQQPMNCPSDQKYCPSSNSCISMNGRCDSGTTGGYNQEMNGERQGQRFGPSEEDERRMREEQFRQMKRGIEQFSRGLTQMKRFVDRMKTRLAREGVGIPTELTNALARAPELLAKLKAAKTMEEFEDLMGDMQDIGMIMQEWGPKLGDLDRLAGMLTQLSRDVRNMTTSFKRVQTSAKRRPELAEAVKELEAMLGVMGKKATDAKALAKTDPEGALDLAQDFYASSEEYWNQVAFVDMVANVTRGLSQANSEIRRAETRIRTLERGKKIDAETIAVLREILAGIKETLPELRAVLAKRPLDYEAVKDMAQNFWDQIQEFESLLSEQGQSFYAPTVKAGEGIRVDIPQGFIAAPTEASGPGGFEGGGGGFGPGPSGPAF